MKVQRVGKLKWTPLQLKALAGHLQEWRLILSGERWEAGRDNACCRAFNKSIWKTDCCRCPIALYAGVILCGSTPYREWQKAAKPAPTGSGQEFLGYRAGNAPAKKAAQAMIAFMEKVVAAGSAGKKTYKERKNGHKRKR